MATERLSMRKIREILRHKWALGRSHREVAASLGISVGAVSAAEQRARDAGLDWPTLEALDDLALEVRLYGATADQRRRPLPDPVYLHTERKKPGGHARAAPSRIPGAPPRRVRLHPVL